MTEIQFADYETGSVVFCQHNGALQSDPARVVRTFVWDLCGKYPVVRKTVEKVRADDEASIEAFRSLIVSGLNQLSSETQNPVLLVIDALDECNPATCGQLPTILTQTSKQLPSFVKFFVTSRPDEIIWTAFNTLEAFSFQPTSTENLKDMEMYARHKLSHILNRSPNDVDSDPAAIAGLNLFVEKSEGRFVRGRSVSEFLPSSNNLLPGQMDSQSLLESIQSFDTGPDNMDKQIMQCISNGATDFAEFHRILSVVIVVLEPVDPVTLAALGG
ncbi:hypothetical protein HDU83_009502 [Entophlyctis luteolus]|nr:hypothetical protein HDU83_009502 [Entophlyctis luteolus]